MVAMLCPECYGWRRSSMDRFCGECGHSFMVIRAETVKPRIVYADRVGDTPLSVVLVLTNAGTVAVGGSQVAIVDQDDRDVFPAETIGGGAMDLPGESVTLRTTIPPQAWRGGRWRGHVVHRMPSGGKTRILGEIDIGRPRPALSLTDDSVMVETETGAQKAEVTMRLRQDSPLPVDVHAVTVYPDSRDGSEHMPEAEQGTFRFSTETADLRLTLSRPVLSELLGAPAGVRYRLAVDLADDDRPYDLPFRLFIPRAAVPTFQIPDRLAALAGERRRAHLRVLFSNRGGEPYSIKRVTVEIVTVDETIIHRALEFAQDGDAPKVPPGAQGLSVLLHIPLTTSGGAALAAGHYRAKLVFDFAQADLEPQEKRFVLDVRAPAPFKGDVFIDFGTVATAVAVSRFDGPRLGEASVLHLGAADSFLPTQIAYVGDPRNGEMTVVIGDEARKAAERAENGEITCFENLKWYLNNRDALPLPDGTTLSWLDVAARYLAELRERIEEHHSVAAEIREVYPTCPARFSTPDRDALFEAYRRAGFDPLRVADASDTWFELSESWAAALLAVPLPIARAFQRSTAQLDQELLQETGDSSYLVLTYDVGGGSTDMSLFRVQPNRDGPMTVVEIATDGDVEFCGNGISRWLFENIESSLHEAMRHHGVTPADVPIHLPWNAISFDGVTPLAVRNGRELGRLVQRLQNNNGPFRNARARRFQPADSQLAEDAHFAVEHQSHLEVVSHWQALGRDVNQESPLGDGPLTLVTEQGRALPFDWKPDELRFAVDSAFRSFVTRFAEPLSQRLERLVARVAPANGERLYTLVTGRGSLFPVVYSMVDAQVKRLFPRNEVVRVRLGQDQLKTVTSHGASLLTHVVNAMPEALSFTSDCAPILGVLGETDPATRLPRFLKLCRGFPTPADGFLKVARAFPPGRRRRVVTLALSRGETPVFDERLHELLTTVQATLDFSPEQGQQTHILIQAPTSNVLRLWIGHPCDGVDPAAPVTDANWMLTPLNPPIELFAATPQGGTP